ncbi:MAG: hypothetical protein R3B84_13975 [Zavarzinella sp.]
MKIASIQKVNTPTEMMPVYDLETESGKYTIVAGDTAIEVSNSKRVSLLDVNALISHGAVHNLREAGSVRGQKNDDYLLQYMSGYSPTQVKVPLVYEKFVNTLKAAGIDMRRRGPKINLMAMTDKQAQELIGDRYLKNGETADLRAGELDPIAGGLFDPKLTQGHNGTVWAGIKLTERMPNPVMEEPIRRLLGLTKKKFEGIIAGEEKLGEHTGVKAIETALANIDVDTEMAKARSVINSGRKSHRDDAVRKLRYLKTLKKTDQKPTDWIMSSVPVLPAAYRPIGFLGDTTTPIVSDPNYMYQELFLANDLLNQKKKLFGDESTGSARLNLYNAYKATVGLADPIHPKLQQKNVKGLLASVFGNSPKMGMVQRKLISSAVDNVGRSVVVPDPEMDMDSIGLPIDMAFTTFKRAVTKSLRQKGMSALEAKKNIEEQTPLAREILLQAMETTPVITVRAPAWHKFSTLSFFAKPVAGSAIHVSPLTVRGTLWILMAYQAKYVTFR